MRFSGKVSHFCLAQSVIGSGDLALLPPSSAAFFTIGWLDAEVDAIAEAVIPETDPTSLCHYTNWSGLFGILTSKEIWVVDFRNQKTDAKEFRHADEIICQVAMELSKELKTTPLQKAVLASFLRTYDRHSAHNFASGSLFLASFCEQADNAKLWKDFADDGSGFVLEFKILKEANRLDGEQVSLKFWPVDYSRASVRERLDTQFRKLLDTVSDVWTETHTRKAMYIWKIGLLRIAAPISAQYKPAEHSGDQEWRLVGLLAGKSTCPIHDNPRRICMPLRTRPEDLPSIKTIYVGSRAPIGEEARVAALLDSVGYTDQDRPPIVRSTTEPLARKPSPDIPGAPEDTLCAPDGRACQGELARGGAQGDF